jgi:environmental stress-induced protein Ves
VDTADMTLHTRRCNQVEPQRWRNGAGFTRELLAWPTASDWQLRISVADIDADAPFSAFPGVDRWFAVLEGAGVVLQLPDGAHTMALETAPLHFAGEAAPDCALIDGPTRDLNLMVRRGSGRATMQRAEAGAVFAPRGGLRALFVADAATLQIDGADAQRLPAFTLLWSEAAQGAWRLADQAMPPRAWWLGFDAGVRT